MAIKGKKKSQSRGSQARRRPAAAPRPGFGGPQRTPWRHTAGGRVTIAIVLALLFGAVVSVIGVVRSNSAERQAQRDQLEDYTGAIKSMTQKLNGPVGEMLAVPLDIASIDESTLADDAKQWAKQISQVTPEAAGLLAPPPVAPVNQLLVQALIQYSAAAETYALIPEAEGPLKAKLLERASAQRDQAAAVFMSAVAVLDAERQALDMSTSKLQTPGSAPPVPAPSPAASPPAASPPAPEDEGEVGVSEDEGKKAGGSGGGKGGKDRKSGRD